MPPPSTKDDKTGYEPCHMAANHELYGTERATREVWAEVTATYYRMITRLDDQLGRVVARTKELGHWDSTVAMFPTDHGEYLGDHGMIEEWLSGLSESLTHEPLIVAGAGLPRGVVYDEMVEMVEMIDLLPTMSRWLAWASTSLYYEWPFCDVVVRGGKDEHGNVIEHGEFAFNEDGFLLREGPLLEQAPYPYDIEPALQREDAALVGKAVSIRDKE